MLFLISFAPLTVHLSKRYGMFYFCCDIHPPKTCTLLMFLNTFNCTKQTKQKR